MRTIIAGPRHIVQEKAKALVEEAIESSGWKSAITEVIHGAATGIDTAAHIYCRRHWPVKSVPAEWHVHGKAAGPIRNNKMAKMADALIAVWDGNSKGTKNMIDTAERLGLKVFIYWIT